MNRLWILPLMMLCASAFSQENELINPGLEADEAGHVEGWWSYRPETNPFVVDRNIKHSGKNSLSGSHVKGGDIFGIIQVITYDKPNKKPIVFGGWSKTENVTSTWEFCIYLDIFYDDGTNAWGLKAHWMPGTHEWEQTYSCFVPEKPVAKILYHVLLRHEAYGKIWLDDLELTRPDDIGAQMSTISMKSMAPLSANGLMINAKFFKDQITYRCWFENVAGKVLATHEGKGKNLHWAAKLDEAATKLVVEATDGVDKRRYERLYDNMFSLPPVTVRKGYRIWTADSMTNVSPLDHPVADAPRHIDLELAKAEYESGQILITAGDKQLDDVNVQLAPLKSDSGETLKGSIKWERVGYITRVEPYSRHPHGYSEGQYWLPDPLLPPRPFFVPALGTQGVWITVHAQRDAKPGTYRGSATIDIQGTKEIVPITVIVFNFELPQYFSYPTAFCVMDGWLFNAYPDGDLNARRRQAWDIMLDHRLNPDDISRTEPPRIEDLLYARSRGMNRFNVLNMVPKPKSKPLWVPYAPLEAYTPELFEEFKQRLDPYVEQLRKHNLTQFAYFYGFDERRDEYYPTIEKTHRFLKERYPEIPFMTTSMMYYSLTRDPDRKDCYANDWYCPLTSVENAELSAKLRAKGHQVWWYTCCGPGTPYANFASIEFPFMDARILPWMAFQHRVDGFLFWHVNLWSGSFRLDESTCYQADFKPVECAGAVGDGQFTYPGVNGPLPSIRLANIRDGSEDYDYLFMAGDKARPYCDKLAKSKTDFSRNPLELRAARRELAKMLEDKGDDTK